MPSCHSLDPDQRMLTMTDRKKNYHIKSKIWIEDDLGNVIFGLGRLRMLSAIDKFGSINAAAKELKMSYRALWGKIKATEEGLGEPLLVRSTGGMSGGGSQLTELARNLIREFDKMHTYINSETDTFFQKIFSKRVP
jgi:molybdate transport system regulatory protein